VVLSGLGWAAADDEKPAPPKTEAKAADAPAPPKADGDKPKAESDEVKRLKKQIEEAVQAGDAAEVNKLAEKLAKALAPKPRKDLLVAPVPPVPPEAPWALGPIPFRVELPEGFDNEKREWLERQWKAVDEQLIERLKDRPEVQEAVRKSLEQMRAAKLRAGNDGLFVFGPDGPAATFPGGLTLGRPHAGRLGAGVARVPEVLISQFDILAKKGLLVTNVMDDSAAAKAGLKKNDVLLKFAGNDVPADERQFIALVAGAKAGEKTEVVVLRKGLLTALTIELPEQPKPRPSAAGLKAAGKKPRVAFETMTAKITDGAFEVKASKGDTRYEVKGTMENGRPTVERVGIASGETKEVYDRGLEAVPEEHRPAVKQLLESVGGN
jgi:membrane-associated protease RseP (regulator of RpoE activity)